MWAAELPDDGPTGGFFRDGRPLAVVSRPAADARASAGRPPCGVYTVERETRVALLLAIGTGLGLGATAIAQDGGSDDLAIDMQSGCLDGTRVTVRITPPSGAILSPVHIRADAARSCT